MSRRGSAASSRPVSEVIKAAAGRVRLTPAEYAEMVAAGLRACIKRIKEVRPA